MQLGFHNAQKDEFGEHIFERLFLWHLVTLLLMCKYLVSTARPNEKTHSKKITARFAHF